MTAMEMKDIVQKVSEGTGIPVSDIMSRKKESEVIEARQIFIYISYRMFGKSHRSIARFMKRAQQGISYQIIVFEQKLKIHKGLKLSLQNIENDISVAAINGKK